MEITIAVAGCGARGQNTYSKILKEMEGSVRVVAAADIDPEKLLGMRAMWGIKPESCYASAEEMLSKERLADAMLICTPDQCHYEEAKAALLKGYHLLLEKPIAQTAKQCRELAELSQKLKRHTVVCHVLRYTPFYQKIKEIITSGALGKVISVQAIEQVCYWHQAHSFVRGNWRSTALSSPMILQKCCHDMDILLWLTGRHCSAVSSFGSLSHFCAENAPDGAPMRCTDGCPAAKTCAFNAVDYYIGCIREGNSDWPVNVVAFDPTEENVMAALRTGPYGRCVYHCDNDVVDHQVVNLEMQDGATVNFTMSAFTAHGGRTIRIMGDKGELLGDMKAEMIRIMPFGKDETEIDVTKLADNFSGHGGGDVRMIKEFIALLQDGKIEAGALSSISRSVESHLVAFAAEESRVAHGSVVNIDI